ncbi:MAG: ankyrin repeat domain-containing protein [Alphaproteobacteria bacterium]|nr:ankyrin repeat domain-containing protein [Alphaproteobacteria bacterium]
MAFWQNIQKTYNETATGTHMQFLDAVTTGDREAVSIYLDSNPQAVNQPEKLTGWTPLILAAGEGNIEMMDLLLARGADMEAKDKRGFTAMLTAARNGRLKAAATLINRGADATVRDASSRNVLSYAAQSGYADEFASLIVVSSVRKSLQKISAAP